MTAETEHLSDAEFLRLVNQRRACTVQLAAAIGVTKKETDEYRRWLLSCERSREERFWDLLGELRAQFERLAESHRRNCRVRETCGTCRTIRTALAAVVVTDEIDMAEEATYQQQTAPQEVPHV